MKQQQNNRGFFRFLLGMATLLIVMIITLFAMGKMEFWSFATTLGTNVLMVVLAVMNLRKK